LEEKLLSTIALLVGIFALVAGFLRLGYLDSIFSKPIANGFITAVACVVMIEQVNSINDFHFHFFFPIFSQEISLAFLRCGMKKIQQF